MSADARRPAPTTGGLLRNVLSNWAVLAGNLLYGLLVTPIVVHALQDELYGVWSFLNGLVAYSALLYLGLGAAVIRFTAMYRSRNDVASLSRLASVILSIYGVLGLLCLAIAVGISGPVTSVFAEPLSADAARAATVTCRLLGVQLLSIFVGSAFAGVLSGHDRFDLANFVQLAAVAARVAAVPLLVGPSSNPLLTLALIMAAIAVVETATLAVVLRRTVPDLVLRLTVPRLDELKRLYGFGFQSFLILFSARVVSNTDTTVIGIVIGARSVTPYSLPLQLVEYGRTMVAGFANVLLPRLAALIESGDLAAVRRAYFDAIRIGATLAGWIAATMVFLGPPFLSRWVGPEYAAPAHWILVFLSAAMFAQVVASQVPLAFYQALHIVSFPAIVLGIEAVVNLILSVWFAAEYGITGVAAATAIPAVLLSGTVLPAYLCRHLAVPVTRLLTTSVAPGLLMLVAVSVTHWLSAGYVDSSTYAGLVVRALWTVPVTAVVGWLVFPVRQRKAIIGLLRR